ncbi:CorA-like protein [Mycena kentingensis (nom. inval.)]|nr:CorA-like protein [Mycena kentingensis (nom. inval.)]
MPRENSFSDSDGRSVTPDLEDEIDPFAERPSSPTYANAPTNLHTTRTRESVKRTVPIPHISPKDRFRRAVRTVISLRQGASVLQRGVGHEPGVDVSRETADAEYGSIRATTTIDVIDYSAVRTKFKRMSNREFVQLMDDPNASEPEGWVKCRWINIGGISWDVIKAVSIRYNLHPLSLEDVFHAHPHARSKVDYYTQHLFMRLLVHELDAPAREQDLEPGRAPSVRRPTAPTALAAASGLRQRRPGRMAREKSTPMLAFSALQAATAPAIAYPPPQQEDPVLQALKRDSRVNVNVAPMFIFLLRDGTVITMHSTPDLAMTEPIAARLRQFDSGLRTSADASLLVQSLLALVTDLALEVVNAYQNKIKHLERSILTKPDMETVRQLHILSADLMLHRRTLEPIKTVVYGLRRFDVDRVAALLENPDKDTKVVGFMSRKAQVYLADVNDHIEYVLSQLDVIANIGENLVDYTFNVNYPSSRPSETKIYQQTVSYDMNEVMRRLMLVTIFFLPLTLLAGYCGMNFSTLPDEDGNTEPKMWIVGHNHGDKYFWIFAVPMTVLVAIVFLTPDLRRGASYARKKVLANNAVKSLMAGN